MRYWLRAATLQIGPRKYSIDGLRFSFEVCFEDSTQLTTATVEVKNLSPETRNEIEKGQVVIINAGYQGDVGLIFVGQIALFEHKRDTVDITTKITATMCLDEWLSREVNKTYAKDASAKDIIADLLNMFGIEVGVFELKQNREYPRGKVCKGPLRDVLTQLVVADCQSRLLIKDSQIIISDPSGGIKMGYLLSPATGLLRAGSGKDQRQTATKLDADKTAEDKAEESPTMTAESLLNYNLGVADEIIIQSAELSGKYIIVRGKHKGSYDGDWRTNLEVRPV